MFRLIRFLKGYRKAAVAGPLFKLMEALFELFIPLVVARIIDVGIANGDTVYIYKMGGVLIGLGVVGFAFSLTCQYLAARASMNFGARVRSELYSHVNKFDFETIDKFGAPSLITRLTNDVNQAQLGVAMFIRLMLRAPFIAIGAIVMAMTISLTMSLIFLAMAVLISVILYVIMSRSGALYTAVQSALDGTALLARENLSGARVVRAFSRQEQQQDNFRNQSEKVSRLTRTVGRISGLLNPLTYALVNLAVIAILYFGSNQVNIGNLSQGQVLALVNYLIQIQFSLVVLAHLIVIFTKSAASAKRINEVFDTETCITDANNSMQEKVSDSPKILFDNIDFSYGKNAGLSLQGINLAINEGETIGIIGATGAGKTTLANLVGRFYDVCGGAVFIDGVDVRAYPLEQLRQKTGYVMQGATLFSGTVRDNIKWGKSDATDEDVWAALKIAMADEFVKALPHDLDSVVAAGGKNFSGGQRQRLTIARALIRKPEILVLDDSSSALDYATDAALRRELKFSTNIMTVIIISQRTSSIMSADKILVLDEGKAVGLGTHNELLKHCDLYKEIYLSQNQAKEEQ
ncbi:atp-binding cassette sub-family b [Holotrichia oblita]|nr:atp-binding cassette sub-family b [Holotrichia oblita]